MTVAVQTVDARIRLCGKNDMPQILAIERTLDIGERWMEDDIRRCAGPQNPPYIAECCNSVVGLLLYSAVNRQTLCIHHVAVHPKWQRRGVGHQLVDKMISKLGDMHRWLVADVDESSLVGQLFLHHGCRFRAVKVLRDKAERLSFVPKTPGAAPETVVQVEDVFRFVYTNTDDYEPNMIEAIRES